MRTIWKVVLVLAGLLVLTCVGGFIAALVFGPPAGSLDGGSRASTATTPAPKSAPAVHDSASRIASTYDANEIAGDNKYSDKRVWITGNVASISGDFSGTDATIELRGTAKTNLTLSFEKKWREGIGELRVGDQIEAECTGNGLHLMTLMFGDCDLKIIPNRR